MLGSSPSPIKVKASSIGVNKMKTRKTRGYWTYEKSNNTVNFRCRIYRRADNEDGPDQEIGPYSYQVDLDAYNVNQWAQHLRESKGKVMTEQDILDLIILCQEIKEDPIIK